MSHRRKIFYSLALTLVAAFVAVIVIRRSGWRPAPAVTIVGCVLKQNADPRKQTPIQGVRVTASDGETLVNAETSPSGLFTLTLGPKPAKRGPVTLTFTRNEYEPLQLTAGNPGDQLYIARLKPLKFEPEMTAKPKEIKNVRVRYSSRDETTISIGSLAKQFAAPNKGNVPCRSRRPCSPDGRWKATETILPIDAEQGNQFRNVRISCVAGPCVFTSIDDSVLAQPAQKIRVSVLNWSDTTNFLVEADVTRTMSTERVRHSYPFIVGQSMSFALPPGSKGASVEADLDGQRIVFPLGPALALSWATCNMETAQDGNEIYRCQAKAGFQFQE